jgi:hypothetical protein
MRFRYWYSSWFSLGDESPLVVLDVGWESALGSLARPMSIFVEAMVIWVAVSCFLAVLV